LEKSFPTFPIPIWTKIAIPIANIPYPQVSPEGKGNALLITQIVLVFTFVIFNATTVFSNLPTVE
jgi:hypothetical protein